MAKIKSSMEYTMADFIKELTSQNNANRNPLDAIRPTKKTLILNELASSRYDYLRPEAIRILLKNNENINLFCDEILDIVAPVEASERQRQILMNTIARAVYGSVYLQKLKEMHIDVLSSSQNYSIIYDDTATENKDILEELAKTRMESYPQLKLSKEKYHTRTFKDTYGTMEEASVNKNINGMKKIPFLSRQLEKEHIQPYVDTIIRLKQYLYNGGFIENIQQPKRIENRYNSMITSAIKTWYNLFLIINSDIDKQLGMSKLEMYQVLNSANLEFAVNGVCELEKLGIKFSDEALRKAIRNFERQSQEEQDIQAEHKETSNQVKQAEDRDNYIIKTALQDIIHKVPKHASIQEWIACITEDKVAELREAGADESTILAYKEAMLEFQKTVLEDKQKGIETKDSDRVYRHGDASIKYANPFEKRPFSVTLNEFLRETKYVLTSQEFKDAVKGIAALISLLGIGRLGYLIEQDYQNSQIFSSKPSMPIEEHSDTFFEDTLYIQDGTVKIDLPSEDPIIQLAYDTVKEYTEGDREEKKEIEKQEKEDEYIPKAILLNTKTASRKRRSDKYHRQGNEYDE